MAAAVHGAAGARSPSGQVDLDRPHVAVGPVEAQGVLWVPRAELGVRARDSDRLAEVHFDGELQNHLCRRITSCTPNSEPSTREATSSWECRLGSSLAGASMCPSPRLQEHYRRWLRATPVRCVAQHRGSTEKYNERATGETTCSASTVIRGHETEVKVVYWDLRRRR